MPVVGQDLCCVHVSISCNCHQDLRVNAVSTYFTTEEAQTLRIKLLA